MSVKAKVYCLMRMAAICAVIVERSISAESGSSTAPEAPAFEGRVRVSVTQGNQTEDLLYAIAPNFLRVESVNTNRPADILDRHSGELILVYPHNASFMRWKIAERSREPATGGMPSMPQLPPGIGPQSTPHATGIAPEMTMPAMPLPGAMEKLELGESLGQSNLLGCACEHFELQQRGSVMEIWATTRFGPFQGYLRNQPVDFTAQTLEERWGDLLADKGLFPLLATLKTQNGAERFRFEVKSVTARQLTDTNLFQPPPHFREIRPLGF